MAPPAAVQLASAADDAREAQFLRVAAGLVRIRVAQAGRAVPFCAAWRAAADAAADTFLAHARLHAARRDLERPGDLAAALRAPPHPTPAGETRP